MRLLKEKTLIMSSINKIIVAIIHRNLLYCELLHVLYFATKFRYFKLKPPH